MNLNQVTLPVHDMELGCSFYLKLGFTQIVDTPHYARFVCPDGNSTFSLSLIEGEINNQSTIYFESDELDQLVERLLTRGIEFDDLPEDKSYLWREANLRDPSGNKIKLYYAGENRLNPPWRVNKRFNVNSDK